MAAKCAHCGSPQVQHEVAEIFCFNCGGKTNYSGQAISGPQKPVKKK